MSKITKLERIDVEDINRFAPKNRSRRCVVGAASGSVRKLSKSKDRMRINPGSTPKPIPKKKLKLIRKNHV